ncbi:helix-turn-helix domain-containing protein [Albirhodobacter sp. R86504]|uniref:arsenate reductase/protein-tyrosine-phosphatase family protein n=1 Tax=Albirhodobacter sp. R86504 TaxID=3093848 RepID=UPI00367221E2
MEELAVTQFATLGHPQRLAVFRLLMRHYPEPMTAGDIAAAMSVKPSTLSVYLAALRQSGLITQERAGTSLLYRTNISGTEALVSYLVEDCCRARPQICRSAAPQNAALSVTSCSDEEKPMTRKFNVLFLCSANSARSIMAESILRAQGEQFNAFSAGTRPSVLNPDAVALLESKGHSMANLRSKSMDEFRAPDAPQMDFVFTVCDQAANEECPAWPGQPISGHWGQPDPVKATGTDAERALAFQTAYGILKHRIAAFVALPFETLDRMSLQTRVDEIAQMRPE